MEKCEICEIMLSNLEEHNTACQTNLKRCIECEFVENRIKEICGLCNNIYKNTLRLYQLFGNTCHKCNKIINAKIKYMDSISRIEFLNNKEAITILTLEEINEIKECCNYIKFYKKNSLSTIKLDTSTSVRVY